jgi:hypothetical protein
MTKDDILRIAQEAQLVRFEGGENEAYQLGQASPDDHSRAYWSTATPEKLARFAASIYMKGYDAGVEDGCEACAQVADLVAREIDDTNGTVTYIAAAIRERGKS